MNLNISYNYFPVLTLESSRSSPLFIGQLISLEELGVSGAYGIPYFL